MQIVPSTQSKNNEMRIEDLNLLKADLKLQIQNQKQKIVVSSKKLVSLASISSYVFGTFRNSFNLMDGVLIGLKLVKMARRIFRKFR
jgi:hypothetical protein